MLDKDYYKILEVSPTATYADIKKSYRRLALQYHPDKNFGNKLYEAKFKEIQEAYKILSDLKQRQEYNSRRNHQQSSSSSRRKPFNQTTAQTILFQTIDFSRKVAQLDPDRMNKMALYQQIQSLLVKSNILLLQQNNDALVNKRIIDELLFCARFLPYSYVEKICFQLTALAGTDNTVYRKIYHFSKEARLRNYWRRYKIFAAIVVAIILCFAIYMLSITI